MAPQCKEETLNQRALSRKAILGIGQTGAQGENALGDGPQVPNRLMDRQEEIPANIGRVSDIFDPLGQSLGGHSVIRPERSASINPLPNISTHDTQPGLTSPIRR